MTQFLVDHNMEGQALLLWGTLSAEGLLDLFPLQLFRFPDVGLNFCADDRKVWRFAQKRQMLLLTANRAMKGPDSLEEVIREENHDDALPVLTIATLNRMDDKSYRDRCAHRIVEICIDLDLYRGCGRLFIPKRPALPIKPALYPNQEPRVGAQL